MLALFNWFGRSYAGWQKLYTHEGVNLLFPEYPARKLSTSQSELGEIQVTMYSTRIEETGLSVILSIRDYRSKWTAKPEDYFADWRNEFMRTMEITGIDTKLLTEVNVPGKHPRCDLLLSNREESSFTRISLVSQGTRLVILFAVGMLQHVSGAACSESFRSLSV